MSQSWFDDGMEHLKYCSIKATTRVGSQHEYEKIAALGSLLNVWILVGVHVSRVVEQESHPRERPVHAFHVGARQKFLPRWMPMGHGPEARGRGGPPGGATTV